MGLRINQNINAVNALRNLKHADRLQSTSLERLSSGLRINRASDDPSGLVISEQFRAQIGGIEQALENTQFSQNMLNTTEAALQEVSDLLSKFANLPFSRRILVVRAMNRLRPSKMRSTALFLRSVGLRILPATVGSICSTEPQISSPVVSVPALPIWHFVVSTSGMLVLPYLPLL